MRPFPLIALLPLLLTACVTDVGTRPRPGDTHTFNVKSIAKSDVDSVTEQHVNAVLYDLRELMIKLYRRNPRELRKSGYPTLKAAVDRIFANSHGWQLPPTVDGLRGTPLIDLAFQPGFRGDRVRAFVVGLATMVVDSYGGRTEFYMFDDVDPQKLYNSARNVEIAAWRLTHRRDSSGHLYLLSTETSGPVVNLSFERLFGKIVALQDVMAKVMEDKTNRTIKGVIQRVASAVFLPI